MNPALDQLGSQDGAHSREGHRLLGREESHPPGRFCTLTAEDQRGEKQDNI